MQFCPMVSVSGGPGRFFRLSGGEVSKLAGKPVQELHDHFSRALDDHRAWHYFLSMLFPSTTHCETELLYLLRGYLSVQLKLHQFKGLLYMARRETGQAGLAACHGRQQAKALAGKHSPAFTWPQSYIMPGRSSNLAQTG